METSARIDSDGCRLQDKAPRATFHSVDTVLTAWRKDRASPVAVTSATLTEYGATAGDQAVAILSTLQTLGLIDAQDHPTDLLSRLLQAPDRTSAYRMVFENSFPALVGWLEDGGRTNADLDEWLIEQCGCAPTLVKATRAFVRQLASAAGFDVAQIKRRPRKTSTASTGVRSTEPTEDLLAGGLAVINGILQAAAAELEPERRERLLGFAAAREDLLWSRAEEFGLLSGAESG